MAYELKCSVQHYDWGGFKYIPHLLGIPNSGNQPNAELWIGAHPNAPSLAIVDGAEVKLNDLIARAPETLLGKSVASRFDNRLPFLFKALDAHKMLSIQAHPTKKQAEERFAQENAAGIPLSASYRNYKDDNHKPEVHVALTEFWMLHGFRPLTEIAEVLDDTPELSSLMPNIHVRLNACISDTDKSHLLRDLYGKIMTMPQDAIDHILNPLIARLESKNITDKDTSDYWALKAAQNFPLANGHRDRGIISAYLLNLVHLQPGQGTYQPAGMLHAYLEGVNMELMANSDNVLRGGLTPKHVDVPELMSVLTFTGGKTEVLDGDKISDVERVYHTPAKEFELSRIELKKGKEYKSITSSGPVALIVLSGSVTLDNGSSLLLDKGHVAFVPYNERYCIKAGAHAVLFKAAIPG